MDCREEKRRLRRALKEKLQEISPDAWREISRRICERLIISSEYLRAGGIFCFVGFGAEIDTRPFLWRAAADGKRVYVPRCRTAGEMDAVLIRGEGDLSCGMFGIPEPPPAFPAADRGVIDLAVVPCLAADEDAWRLGRGGGYYDRFLEGFSGDTVLVCPEALVLPRVPREEWDRKCGRLITEDRG
ncbi:MAG: 5-formyltetrahydrofolate cyclo-ligase [Clostridia bacterium]|nr:5-formyltetrahydrofolate cyclo-ligase [Clostridia bacterium]